MGIKPSKIALLISGVFSLTALPTMAAESNQSITDETITVTGTRFDRTSQQQLTVINTVERADIERLNPKSVADVLETMPGVSVVRNGGAGQNVSVSLRGTNSSHVLVIVDGVKIGSATLGSVSFNTLSAENIERIEVLKGPRASVWGSDAIGGVIQIFTRQLKSDEGYIAAEYGSNEYLRGSASVGLAHGNGSSTLAVNHEQSDGYDVYQGAESETDDDGYQRNSFSLKGEQNLNEQWQVLWSGQYDKGHTEFDDIYGSGAADETDYANHVWHVGTQYSGEQLSSKLTLSQSRDYNENYRGDQKPQQTVDYETKRQQVSWNNQYDVTEGLNVNAGVDWANEAVLGDYAQDERDILGAYILVGQQWEQLLAEVAVRYDDVENIDSETTYNVSLAYQLNDQWRVSATTGTAFKVPTFNDLYWPGSGNPELLSETSTSYDITLDYRHEAVNAYISVFKNDIDNLIAWAPTGAYDDYGWEIWLPDNINQAEITGVELSAQFALLNFEHQVSYTYLDAEDATTGDMLVGRSESELNYSLSYQWQEFDLLANYHYQSKRYEGYDQYLDAYHQVDLSLGYAVTDNWQLRVKANNIFDEEIISKANYLSPGRELFLSVSYNAL
ncbi:TonB-dependent receptor domain-containing protein [Shewanella youngdeokensis]|uniref:TonB-dependent receptor n=1 Tax=Shewanella youngdeokensis TaxID=2999068 RepID=A0ABZ0K031_9GAMM|nr:TonB-dependent receptor [Shewanella sp. DAU334]